MRSSIAEDRAFLLGVHDAAIAAVIPDNIVAQHLKGLQKVSGDTLFLCIGKADMAGVVAKMAMEKLDAGTHSMLVVAKHGSEKPDGDFTYLTAGHPDPDRDSIRAADEIIAAIEKLKANGKTGNRIVVFMSGGASALMFKPAGDISAQDGFAAGKAIVNAGMDIVQMNTLRRELSLLAGGGIAKLAGPDIEMITYAISDVPPENEATVIGSGPTVPSPTGFDEARKIITDAKVNFPQAVMDFYNAGEGGSIKADDRTWHNKTEYTVMANNVHALEAAADYARSKNITPIIIPKRISGDAVEAAKEFAALAAEITRTRMVDGKVIDGEILILQGGEPTVKLPDGFDGEGGRAHHAALQFAVEMENSGIPKEQMGVALLLSTDGGDGRGPQRAAFIDPETLARGSAKGLDAIQHIADFRTVYYLRTTGDSLPAKPTGTNVCDVWAYKIPAKKLG